MKPTGRNKFGEEKGKRSIRGKSRPRKKYQKFSTFRNYFRRKRRGKEARSIRRGGNNKDSRHEKKKAAGIDGIPMEAWIYGGSTMRKGLTEILMQARGKNGKRKKSQRTRGPT